MLKKINNLQYFFEDNYRRIHVREYAKLINISPPTASKLLEEFVTQELLKKEIDKQYFYYYANKESRIFKALQQIYWQIKLEDVIHYVEKESINPIILLFGSAAKAEISKNSDIDIAIISPSTKKFNLQAFEEKIGRTIQIIQFNSLENIPKNLRNNILNGYKLSRQW
ncbi:MAG: nucleotidyltransferase domain-containing protein [Candidatus Nanoarchaeia archaeon]